MVMSRLQRIIMVVTVGISPTWCQVPWPPIRTLFEIMQSNRSNNCHSGMIIVADDVAPLSRDGQSHLSYSPDQYVIGIGRRLTKGPIVCQRGPLVGPHGSRQTDPHFRERAYGGSYRKARGKPRTKTSS